MKRVMLALTLVVGVWPATSEAAPLFFDDFNGENGGQGLLNAISGDANEVGILTIPFIVSSQDSIKFSFKNSGADFRDALPDDVELNMVGDAARLLELGLLVLLGSGLVYLGRRLRRGRKRSN